MSTAEEGPLANLPGFFWDKDKGRYFKIEKRGPAEAPYTADNIKRRKQEEQSAIEKARLEKRARMRPGVQRAGVFLDPLMGGLLRRELGLLDAVDVGATAFARNLQERGSVPTLRVWDRPSQTGPPASMNDGTRVDNFWIGGSDVKSGLGVAHLFMSDRSVRSYYLPRDKNDNILGNSEQHYRLIRVDNGRPAPVGAFEGIRQFIPAPVSSIKYHGPSDSFLISYRDNPFLFDCSLRVVRFPSSKPLESDRPLWDLSCGNSEWARDVSRCIFTSAPAPASSPLMAVLGAKGGLLELPLDITDAARFTLRRPKRGVSGRKGRSLEILALDFQAKHHSVVFVGGSAEQIWLADLRDRSDQWPHVRTGTPITHVKSIDENCFLAAGIKNHLAVYDTRFPFRNGPGPQERRRYPVCEFHQYKNEAHLMEIGLDMDSTLGVVAAAHDDGKVAIYSLKTGLRLPSPIIEAISEASVASVIQFATLPGDKNPSLFVPQQGQVKKYSFASGVDEWGKDGT